MAKKGTIPWNAGTSRGWIDKRGYRWVYITENGRRRARREHRVIMEQHLGRKLEPHELVHHKDGNTANNALGNLELQEFGEHSLSHHKGTRKTEYTKKTLGVMARYREEVDHLRRINSDLLEALGDLLAHSAKVNYAFYVEGKTKAMQAAMQGQKELLQKARAAIAKAEGLSNVSEANIARAEGKGE